MTPADACTCVTPPPPAEALGQSDAVFAGEVLGGLTADRSDIWVVALGVRGLIVTVTSIARRRT